MPVMLEPTAPLSNDFDCAKRGDGQDGSDEFGEIIPGDIGEAETLCEEQGLGDGSDHCD